MSSCWFFQRRQVFAGIVGLTDGILTSLTLAAGRMVQSNETLPLSLAVRIAAASAPAGAVVFFTAELARRNHELVHAERQLNLLSHGYLATTRLGHFVLIESSEATLIVMAANFLGAFAPLLIGVAFQQFVWTSICFSLLLLGILGSIIAQVTYRSRVYWTSGLMIAGAALTLLGIWLRIV